MLREVAQSCIDWLQDERQAGVLANHLSDYHGFAKRRLPEHVLKPMLAPYGLTPRDIQVELVGVFDDLSREAHTHARAHALACVLGRREGLLEPVAGYAFVSDRWLEAISGMTIDIPPGTVHTFAVKPGGVLYFLSVQAPPIEDGAGGDDYVRVQIPKCHPFL